MVLDIEKTSFEDFRDAWVEDIDAMESTTDKGREFALRLASQWLDVDADSDNFYDTGDAGDGGIDIAYLYVGADEANENQVQESTGDVWYLFQCKYGTAGEVGGMPRRELRKMFETIVGDRPVSQWAGETVEKVRHFARRSGGSRDRLHLVIATIDPLRQVELEDIDDLRADLASELSRLNVNGPSLEIEAVSLKNVHDSLLTRSSQSVQVHLDGQFIGLNQKGAFIGRVSIKSMYEMLAEYRKSTGELDRIYDKNVRRWLGMSKYQRVGSGIAETIRESPENLGIYNNGVTFVCSDFRRREDANRGRVLIDPYIVNGCQTTRTLFAVVDAELGAGGTRKSSGPGQSYSDCYLVVKVVVTDDPDQLTDITRYTNTQTAVRDSDLVSIDSNYNRWKRELAEQHGMYLEIQRGGWESRRALEKSRPGLLPRLTGGGAVPVKANDMMKVFGAGWLGFAGTAARRTADFLPGPVGNSSVFAMIKEIADDGRFGADDFRACHAVFLAGKRLGFGRGGSGIQFAMTRYMFYYAFVELIRAIGAIGRTPASLPTDEVTRYVLALEPNQDDFSRLADAAALVVSDYTVGRRDIPPYQLDKAFNETGNWEGVVKSHRMDAKHLADEVPGFRRAIDNRIENMETSTIDDQIVLDRYRESIGVGQH